MPWKESDGSSIGSISISISIIGKQ